MLNRSKINDILKGAVLLKVDSLQKPLSKNNRKITLGVATLVYVFGWIYSAFITADAPRLIKFSIPIILTLLYIMVVPVLFLLSRAKENSLTITERGLAFWPIVAEKWEDIESYSWEEFKGINRVPGPTVFSSCEGVTLRIIIKGLLQRCLENRTSHSIFATYLIFFSPDQIAATEAIMNQHGIKKAK
jgi:uncharacterized membrane protein YhdT